MIERGLCNAHRLRRNSQSAASERIQHEFVTFTGFAQHMFVAKFDPVQDQLCGSR